MSRRVSRAGAALLGAAALGAVFAVATVSSSEHGIAAQLVGANRPHYWHVAWKEYTLNPITGSGAGTFDSFWLHYRPVSSFARDAHSLYVETLAELGPVGLALLLVGLALPIVSARAAARASRLGAAAAAGYVAFLVHAFVDWDWELPAVTVPALALGAAVVILARRPSDARPVGSQLRLVCAVAVVLVAIASLLGLRSTAEPAAAAAPRATAARVP